MLETRIKKAIIHSHEEEIRDFFHAAITVDCVIFGYESPDLKILTIQSYVEHFKGMTSLVGDLVQRDETLENAAARILEYRTGLRGVHLDQIKTYGHPDRHPLGRVITTAFYSLINIRDFKIDEKKGEHPEWVAMRNIDKMAFDHLEILRESLKVLRHRFFDDALYASLLPEKFTLSELQHLSEEVLQTKFDKRNFRKKMLNTDDLIETDEQQLNVNHRPAKLYRVNPHREA
jgi:8-oxo-dGTP diphosphatase